MDSTSPPVAIVMGSQSDWETMKEARDVLAELGVETDTRIVSAHRTPDRLYQFARTAKAAAGRSSSPARAARRICPA